MSELLRSYEKDKARGKADSIEKRLADCGIRKMEAIVVAHSKGKT